ncbi:hypothetical protein PSI93_RS01855 [Escherichia coli]
MRDDADGREYNARNEFSGGGGGIPLYATPQVQVVPEAEPVAYQYRQWDAEYDEWGEWEDCGESAFERFVEEEKCLGAGVQTRKLYTAPPAHQPGGFTIEETQELYEDLVRSHISQALSGEKMKKSDRDADLRWIHGVIVQAAWFVKASLEQNALSGNSPVTPDGWVMVPKKLTAENGAKGVLSGEFSETTFISCPECFGDDDCDTCDGSGRIEIKVPVTWTTIKSIWDKGIAHFAAKPPQEVNRG